MFSVAGFDRRKIFTPFKKHIRHHWIDTFIYGNQILRKLLFEPQNVLFVIFETILKRTKCINTSRIVCFTS